MRFALLMHLHRTRTVPVTRHRFQLTKPAPCSSREVMGSFVKLGEHVVKIAAGEGPFEGGGGFLIALLEPDQIAVEDCNAGEVIGVEKLALDN
jgi:hypothetical protein